MAHSSQPVYEFGDFRVEVRERLLRAQGQAMAITPKAFDTLVLLLENAGRLVEKDTFFARLWPDTVVEEASLAQNISMLRKLLTAGTDGTKFIETVPKRGYRFVAAVRRIEAGETDSASAARGEAEIPVVLEAPKKRRRRVALAAIGLVALIVAAGMLVYVGRQRPAAGAIRSIAVLPLENLSGDPNQEFLSDGITDELITALARMHSVRVISRASTMIYKGSRKPLPQIARELNVDAVLEGSMVSAGGRVRLRAQLIRGATDEHVWAEAYERDLRDVLAVESELARDVAGAIRSQLPAPAHAERPVNAEVHELYLKGRYFWNRRNQQSLNKAIDYFQQAIAKDPNYAAAFSGLADCYILLGGYGVMPLLEALEQAKTAAENALRLDDELAEAHTSLGLIKTFDGWNWAESRRQFERAIQLNPNYATAHHWYGDGYLAPMGRMDEALAELRKAQELDPLSPVIAADLGKALHFARRYDEAIAQFRRALELDPDSPQAHAWLEHTYIEKGMYTEAAAELKVLDRARMVQHRMHERAYLLAREGRHQEARQLLRDLMQMMPRSYLDPGCIAMLHTALGDKDQAFAWLEKAYLARSSYMTSLKVLPGYDPLRSDPRFDSLVRRVGLEH